MRQAWGHNESPEELGSRKLKILGGVLVVGVLLVGVCGLTGGSSGAGAGVAMLVALLCIAGFAVSQYVWERRVGEITIEGATVLETRSGRRIDLRQPHTLSAVKSQNITKTIVVDAKRGTRNEASLVYDWVVLVLRQGAIEIPVIGRSVYATRQAGYATVLTADRTFAGPTVIATTPPRTSALVHIDMMAFDDYERGLLTARSAAGRS